jgi:hypothetical protein
LQLGATLRRPQQAQPCRIKTSAHRDAGSRSAPQSSASQTDRATARMMVGHAPRRPCRDPPSRRPRRARPCARSFTHPRRVPVEVCLPDDG